MENEMMMTSSGNKIPALHPSWIDSNHIWIPLSKNTEVIPFLESDLTTLLQMSPHVFWSSLLHDAQVRGFLRQSLSNLPRVQETHSISVSNSLISSVARLLFLVYVRVFSHKSSGLSSQFYGKILYDNYIVDIPLLLELSSLYGSSNGKILSKMFESIFKIQSLYYEDWNKTIELLVGALHENSHCLLNDSFISEYMSTLEKFFLIAPSTLAQKSSKLAIALANFYSQDLIGYCEKIPICKLNIIRHSLLVVVYNILQLGYVLPLLENDNIDELRRIGDEYLEVLTSLLSETYFLEDYNAKYDIEEDLEILISKNNEIDSMRVQYIRNGLSGTMGKTTCTKTQNESVEKDSNISEQNNSSLVNQIQDLMPELENEFLTDCLAYYDYKVESVLNALFENNLPPHLEIKMTKKKTEESKKFEDKIIPVANRSNVYDYDEFDIFSRNTVDTSRIHRGKKTVIKNEKEFLNDKSNIDKSQYEQFSIVSEILMVHPSSDDEYDDTYDDLITGHEEPDAFEGRAFVLPRALGGGHIRQETPESNSEEDVEKEENSHHFCRNPEELRAQAEMKRKLRGNTVRDVVGRSKGQGQEKSVLINRSRKNANKGKHVRHMADKKFSKGMF